MVSIYRKLGWRSWVITLLLLAVTACNGLVAPPGTPTPIPTLAFGSPVSLPYGKYTDIAVADLKGLLAHKNFVLINVSSPPDGQIEGTDLQIPYDQIDQNLAKLPRDKATMIVVYCRNGRPCGIASAALVKLGYTQVLNLVGGLDAWQKAGYPIVK